MHWLGNNILSFSHYRMLLKYELLVITFLSILNCMLIMFKTDILGIRENTLSKHTDKTELPCTRELEGDWSASFVSARPSLTLLLDESFYNEICDNKISKYLFYRINNRILWFISILQWMPQMHIIKWSQDSSVLSTPKQTITLKSTGGFWKFQDLIQQDELCAQCLNHVGSHHPQPHLFYVSVTYLYSVGVIKNVNSFLSTYLWSHIIQRTVTHERNLVYITISTNKMYSVLSASGM